MTAIAEFGWSEAPPDSADYINRAVTGLARAAGAKSALDAGCGNGALAADLAAAGLSVTGVDGDAEGIAIARRKYPALDFRVGSFDRAPPDAYDLVCTTEVIEHLYAPHELVRYAFDALRPGGTLIVSTPYHGYLKNLALAVADGWDRHFTAAWHGGHIKFWSRRSLTALLEAGGFEVTRFVGVGRYPLLWKSMILVARRP